MLDVIEHTDTPRGDLKRAYAIARPGGVLLLKTFYDEFHGTLDLRIDGPTWDDPRHGFFDPFSHPWHFDVPVLLTLIERCGWRPAQVERAESLGLITVYATRT